MTEVKIGVIGGSGLYQMNELKDIEEVKLNTAFGDPSDAFIIGTLADKRIAFLSRHGRGHRITPTEINYRANIYGFKKLGVDWLVSVSAVGSMKEHIKPLDFVVPDQFYDNTKRRIGTFFGNGIVGHVGMANPVCPHLSALIEKSCKSNGVTTHKGGTYICIEGPQFSTKGESLIYRKWGVDVIGMTNMPEAKLAREAEICYATMALVTDFDCWHESEEVVTIDAVIATLMKNVNNARSILRTIVQGFPISRDCECSKALANGVITQKEFVPEKTLKDLELIVGKYLK
ncbi:MAG TPA: S-methyl-5'-thioadenosine phosphorylase [Acidobacteriota bacterium]|nr:S-methyl-5'-thioadenosine phosphorylase [Acidobacteriota bacterium]